MHVLALQVVAESGGQIERSPARSASTGRIWLRRSSASGSCAPSCTLLAYKPILRMLEARRQQIASGLANAEKIKAELARIEAERQAVLAKAGRRGQAADRGSACCRRRVSGPRKRRRHGGGRADSGHARARPPTRSRAMLAELKREVGRLVVQTTATVTGKVLTADDHRRLAEETARQLSVSAMKVDQEDQAVGATTVPAVPRRRQLDEGRVRQVARRIGAVQAPRRAGRALGLSAAGAARSRPAPGVVESATPLTDDVRASVRRRPGAHLRPGAGDVVRTKPRAHRRHAHQGRQRRLRRQRARASWRHSKQRL